MKTAFFSSFAFVIFFSLVGCNTHTQIAENPPPRLQLPSDDYVMVIAHRACWRMAPENSLAAINACIQHGVDMVELDVRLTQDQQLVLMHDSTLERTTNGQGKVSDFTLSELSALFLKASAGGQDASLSTEKIPTLKDALMAAKGNILVNIDAKGEVLEKAINLAGDLGVLNQIVVKMSMDTEKQRRKANGMPFLSKVAFMPIIHQDGVPAGRKIQGLQTYQPIAFEVIYKSIPFLKNAASATQKTGTYLWVNTMWERLSPGHTDLLAQTNPDDHWGYLIDQGVNMIQTDSPIALIRYLQSKNKH